MSVAERLTVITVVSPLLQFPLAPVTVTGYEPVMIKSDPSAAIELHLIGFRNTSSSDCGLQPGVFKLSIGVGANGKMVNGSDSFSGTLRSQLSSKVLPSFPFTILSV